jgi:hypothetical protein
MPARQRLTRFVWASPRPTNFLDAGDSPAGVRAKPSVRSTSSSSLDLIQTTASHQYSTMPGRTRPIDKLAAAVGKCSTEVRWR